MKTRHHIFHLLLAAMLGICGSVSAATLDISSDTIGPGEEFWVDVDVSDLANLYGLAFDLDYDDSLIEVVDESVDTGVQPVIEEGTVLNEGGGVPTAIVGALPDDEQGKLVVGISRLGAAGTVSTGTDQLVVRVKFKAVGVGTTTVTFSSNSAEDDAGAELTVDSWNGGSYQIKLVITIADVLVDESDGSATVTATLNAAAPSQVTVDYTTNAGTATLDSDFTADNGTLTWLATESGARTISLGILDNNIQESTESFTVSFTNVTGGAELSQATATITINDDDLPPGITISDLTLAEGDNGGIATVTITLTGATGSTVSVDFATAGDSATSGTDFTSSSGAVSWTPGQSGARTVNIAVNDDNIDEPTESFFVNLSNAQNADLNDNQATVTINDNDDEPTVSILADDVGEGDGSVLVTVRMTGRSSSAISVNYASADGSASAGSDYTAVSGTLTWNAETTGDKSFSVSINDDDLDEPDETFSVGISNFQAAGIGTSSVVVTIEDNDAEPTISISDKTVAENDASGFAQIQVTMSGRSGSSISVNYATGGGTASAGSDYTTTNGTLTWSAGETGTKTFNVPLLNDFFHEDTETVGLSLSSFTIAAISDGNGTLTITDDDVEPSITISDVSVSESIVGGQATVTVSMTGYNPTTVSVAYTATGDTATADADFTEAFGELTWLSGATGSMTFNVPILDDDWFEGSEIVGLSISTDSTVSLSTNTADLTINDDEEEPEVCVSGTTTVAEGGTLTLQVTLSGKSQLTVTILAATSEDTATDGVDYQTVAQTLIWTPGSMGIQNVQIVTIDDSDGEGNEDLTLDLSNPQNVLVCGSVPLTITILDNDSTINLVYKYSVSGKGYDNGKASLKIKGYLVIDPLTPKVTALIPGEGAQLWHEAQFQSYTFDDGKKDYETLAYIDTDSDGTSFQMVDFVYLTGKLKGKNQDIGGGEEMDFATGYKGEGIFADGTSGMNIYAKISAKWDKKTTIPYNDAALGHDAVVADLAAELGIVLDADLLPGAEPYVSRSISYPSEVLNNDYILVYKFSSSYKGYEDSGKLKLSYKGWMVERPTTGERVFVRTFKQGKSKVYDIVDWEDVQLAEYEVNGGKGDQPVLMTLDGDFATMSPSASAGDFDWLALDNLVGAYKGNQQVADDTKVTLAAAYKGTSHLRDATTGLDGTGKFALKFDKKLTSSYNDDGLSISDAVDAIEDAIAGKFSPAD